MFTTSTAATLDAIEAIAARRYAAANGPIATARRAVFALKSVLDDLSESERAEILDVLRTEIPAAAACGFAALD